MKKEYTIEELKEAEKRCGMFTLGECSVIVGLEAGWHLSIAHPNRYPTYDEIKEARYKFLPNEATMAMLFPPKEEFINLHNNCFHLWEI